MLLIYSKINIFPILQCMLCRMCMTWSFIYARDWMNLLRILNRKWLELETIFMAHFIFDKTNYLSPVHDRQRLFNFYIKMDVLKFTSTKDQQNLSIAIQDTFDSFDKLTRSCILLKTGSKTTTNFVQRNFLVNYSTWLEFRFVLNWMSQEKLFHKEYSYTLVIRIVRLKAKSNTLFARADHQVARKKFCRLSNRTIPAHQYKYRHGISYLNL